VLLLNCRDEPRSRVSVPSASPVFGRARSGQRQPAYAENYVTLYAIQRVASQRQQCALVVTAVLKATRYIKYAFAVRGRRPAAQRRC